MQAESRWRDEADHLIALHGQGAIGTLVSRISDAVRMCDDHEVGNLDLLLQLVEARIEGPWRGAPLLPAAEGPNCDVGARTPTQDRSAQLPLP